MRKNMIILMLALLVLSACGSDSREEDLVVQQEQAVEDSIPTISGEFMYLADAAVLKGDDFIYGVTIDSLSTELAQQVRPLKADDFDMVPVVVKAEISTNRGLEGWDEVIRIIEILEVSGAPADNGATEDPLKQN